MLQPVTSSAYTDNSSSLVPPYFNSTTTTTTITTTTTTTTTTTATALFEEAEGYTSFPPLRGDRLSLTLYKLALWMHRLNQEHDAVFLGDMVDLRRQHQERQQSLLSLLQPSTEFSSSSGLTSSSSDTEEYRVDEEEDDDDPDADADDDADSLGYDNFEEYYDGDSEYEESEDQDDLTYTTNSSSGNDEEQKSPHNMFVHQERDGDTFEMNFHYQRHRRRQQQQQSEDESLLSLLRQKRAQNPPHRENDRLPLLVPELHQDCPFSTLPAAEEEDDPMLLCFPFLPKSRRTAERNKNSLVTSTLPTEPQGQPHQKRSFLHAFWFARIETN